MQTHLFPLRSTCFVRGFVLEAGWKKKSERCLWKAQQGLLAYLIYQHVSIYMTVLWWFQPFLPLQQQQKSWSESVLHAPVLDGPRCLSQVCVSDKAAACFQVLSSTSPAWDLSWGTRRAFSPTFLYVALQREDWTLTLVTRTQRKQSRMPPLPPHHPPYPRFSSASHLDPANELTLPSSLPSHAVMFSSKHFAALPTTVSSCLRAVTTRQWLSKNIHPLPAGFSKQDLKTSAKPNFFFLHSPKALVSLSTQIRSFSHAACVFLNLAALNLR